MATCSLPGGLTSFRVVGGILLASVHCSPQSVQDEVPSGVTTGVASTDILPRGKRVSVIRVYFIVLQFCAHRNNQCELRCVFIVVLRRLPLVHCCGEQHKQMGFFCYIFCSFI
jgi:hypothetical protein